LLVILLFPAVVESHPDNAHPDLRLDRPFPGLVEYVNALDLRTMTKQVIKNNKYITGISSLVCLLKKHTTTKNWKEKATFISTLGHTNK